jgi:hypothetical protein
MSVDHWFDYTGDARRASNRPSGPGAAGAMSEPTKSSLGEDDYRSGAPGEFRPPHRIDREVRPGPADQPHTSPQHPYYPTE